MGWTERLRGLFGTGKAGMEAAEPSPSFGSVEPPPKPRFPLDRLERCADTIMVENGRISVAPAPAIWSFLAVIAPPESAEIAAQNGAAAINLTMTVESGTVGVGILAKDSWSTLLDESFVEAGATPAVVRLLVDDIAASGRLVFRNVGKGDGPISCRIESVEVVPIAEQAARDGRNTLYAFYDLNVFPLTYDFAFFLVAAEMGRCDSGLEDIHVVFVPADQGALHRLPAGFDAIVNEEGRRWRFFHILVPLLRLLPSVRGFSVPPSRSQAQAILDFAAHRFPKPFGPNEVPIHEVYKIVNGGLHRNATYRRLRATFQATRYVRQWLDPRAKGRKLVTVTLRQYKFETARNSNLASWIAFARSLDPREFFPVVIPDTDVALEEFSADFEGLETFSVAAFDLELRMALYEAAWLNMLTNGGPFALLSLSEKSRFLIFKFLIPGLRFCSEEDFKAVGTPIGGQFPYHGPMQRIVWDTDSLDVLQREFAAMRKTIDGA